MSRGVPASIEAMLAAAPADLLTLTRCVVFQLRDGTVIGMSDHDRPLTVTLPDVGPVVLMDGVGFLVGDILIAVTLDAGNTEVTAPISQYIGRPQTVGRRFNQSKVWMFDLDWASDVLEPMEIMKGLVGEARVEEGVAVFEVRDQNDYWNVTIGGVLTPRCRADFGDAQCGMVREEVAATITAVTSSMVFTTSLAGAYATNHFRFGDCQFTSGALAGVWPIEVLSFDGATGEIEVLVPFPDDPQVGDAIKLHNGCSKLKNSTTDPTLQTCFFYNNVLRFRGFDQVPGSDTYLKMAPPGGG